MLGDFFPVFSWHQSDFAPNNLCLVFDADLVPFPEFRVMFQYGLDDINIIFAGVADEPIPTIDGLIFGLEYTRQLPFAGFTAYGEIGYTHYLWGSYNNTVSMARSI